MTFPTRIRIVEIGDVRLPASLLDHVIAGVAQRFPAQIECGREKGWSTDGENKVLADDLLDWMASRIETDAHTWVIGLTDQDLTAPGRDWVFGRATVGGRWAVVSLARFGDPNSPGPRMYRRSLAEVIHELGHVAGLDHCDSSDCVMAPSARVADIDGKKSDFCQSCQEALPGSPRS